MVNVLIALVVVSFIFEGWLLSKVNKLDKENKIHRKSLQMALEALARDNHNFQAGISKTVSLNVGCFSFTISDCNSLLEGMYADFKAVYLSSAILHFL